MESDHRQTPPVVLVTREAELRAAVARLLRAPRVALDIESNGLFRYRASLCTMQLATSDEVVIVDTVAAPLGPLAELLGPGGPRKIVHDVAFDARILAEAGLVLGNVLDTSLAARMLGRTATGLASLLASELGITMDKKLQHHDWTERPLRSHHLRYLADDVVHLAALADRLSAEVDAPSPHGDRGIADAVEEETRYRVAQAIAAAGSVDPRPPWVRLKGVDRAPREELPILRRLAELREDKARSLDVPPYKVIGPDVLFAIARAKPKTMADLERIKGATGGHRARSLAPAMLAAVAAGLADDGAVPADERAMLERPRLPPAVVKARRGREGRLTSWRKAEAKRRGIDEQVVLPGHCLQDLADLPDDSALDAVATVPGIGAFRVARDGAALVAALAGSPLGDATVREACAVALATAPRADEREPS
ncbi:MAG: HRDC domain-containing protein [Labilithrix sp.]|nr:HRDC domain-containing protein [Labilithrix sp.]